MDKGWRPEGWETLKAKNHPLHCLAPDDCVGASFEAGADALLKEIKKNPSAILGMGHDVEKYYKDTEET